MDAAPAFRLLVGLGNPGREYVGTRHNAGFMVLDRLAKKLGAAFQPAREWRSDIALHDGVRLCKPLCFMNLSGEPVGDICRYFHISPSETLVILDDAALPLGRLRLREGGSAGGHNGLKSVIEHLGTQAVPRLRIGIGAADGSKTMTGHVLGHFQPDEQLELDASLDRATEAILLAQERGFATAMNLFNKSEPTKS